MTCAVVLITLAAPALMNSTLFDAPDVFKSLLFIPYVNKASGLIRPVLQLGWTLNYEMFFYLLIAACLWLEVSKRVLVLSVVLVALAGLQWLAPNISVFPQFYGFPITLEFAFGMVIALFYLRGGKIGQILCWASIIAGIGIAALGIQRGVSEGADRVIFWGIPAALAVLAAVMLETWHGLRSWRFLAYLGEASYAIYLTHLFTLRLGSVIISKTPLAHAAMPLLVWLLLWVFAIAIGVLVHAGLEKPMTRAFRAKAERGGNIQKSAMAG